MSENLNQKIINNAISAYLMLFISWMFLVNKHNPYINNDFVKNHTKSAIVIHLLVIVNTIIFLIYKLFWDIQLFWFSLNIAIANIIFLLIWIIFINGIYNASIWKQFNIWNFIDKAKWINLDLNNDNNFDEKDKLNLLISHIPFLGFIIWSKFKNEKTEDIIKLNLFISLLISLIYILWYDDITNILSLFYIIFIVFSGVNIYTREELLTIKLPYYFLPKWKIALQKILFKYLLYYFKWDFKEFEIVKEFQFKKDAENETEDLKYLNTLENLKLNKNLIYIPILNNIFLFQEKNKYTFHIRNSLIINIIFLILLILIFFSIISSKWLLLILFPICFGIWKINEINYKMPYIYEIYRFLNYIKNIFISSKKVLKEKKEEVLETKFKVK